MNNYEVSIAYRANNSTHAVACDIYSYEVEANSYYEVAELANYDAKEIAKKGNRILEINIR